MNNIIGKRIIKINHQSSIDRIYNQEAISVMIQQFNAKKLPFYGQIGYPSQYGIFNPSHVTKRLWIQDQWLWADIKILKNNMGEELKNNIDQYIFRPNIIGYIDNNIVIVDKFCSINAISKEQDTFDENILEFETFS